MPGVFRKDLHSVYVVKDVERLLTDSLYTEKEQAGETRLCSTCNINATG